MTNNLQTSQFNKNGGSANKKNSIVRMDMLHNLIALPPLFYGSFLIWKNELVNHISGSMFDTVKLF